MYNRKSLKSLKAAFSEHNIGSYKQGCRKKRGQRGHSQLLPSWKGGGKGEECPFRPTVFSKKLDQGLFQSALLPSKYHYTFQLDEVYLTVFIWLQVLQNSTVFAWNSNITVFTWLSHNFYKDISAPTSPKTSVWLKPNMSRNYCYQSRPMKGVVIKMAWHSAPKEKAAPLPWCVYAMLAYKAKRVHEGTR